VTHDISDTLTFDQVAVMEHGQIIENGKPEELAAQTNSAYYRMLEADRSAWDSLWSNQQWRTLWLENGKLSENSETSNQECNAFMRCKTVPCKIMQRKTMQRKTQCNP